MGKRSRLRTQGVGRRRLVVPVILLCVIAVVWGWIDSDRTLRLLGRAGNLLNLGTVQLTTEQELTRGTIYDRNYKEFAISYERVSVYANIREIEDVHQVIGPLSAILETSESDLLGRMGKGRLRVWLARDISQDQEDEIKTLGFPGIHLHREYIRYYPQKESAAHLIGFVERDTGLFGIEQFLNKLETRYRLKQDDTHDLPETGETRPGIDGRHLILTLDAKIQRILEDYLKGLSAVSPQSRHGALLMDASTGGLIGYAQTPSFDPNNFHAYPEDRFGDLFNEKIAVPDVFKVFFRELSLLESQASPGQELLPWSICAEERKLGVQLQLWNKLGADGRLEYDFIGVPPQEYGAVPFRGTRTEANSFETVPEMQTPLQVLTAMTRTLNGGYEITPHGSQRFVLRRNQQEFLLEDLDTQPSGGLLSEAVSAELTRLLDQLGKRGPLGSKFLQGVSRSLIDSNVERLFHHYLAVVLIPQKNPDLVMLITSTGPGYTVEHKEEFSPAASAAKIIGQTVALHQVMKNLSDMMSPSIQEDKNFSASSGIASSVDSVRSDAAVETEMVSLVGMSLRKALRILQASNVEVEIQGSGRVVSQHPSAGTKLKSGSRVTLVLRRDQVDPGYQRPQFTEPE